LFYQALLAVGSPPTVLHKPHLSKLLIQKQALECEAVVVGRQGFQGFFSYRSGGELLCEVIAKS